MPRFISKKDSTFFQSINQEFINRVVETDVTVFKTVIDASDVDDIYGESINRSYYVGIKINCLINRSNQESDNTDFGQDIKQQISFAFNRYQLEQKNTFPEHGDVIEWNGFYYSVDNVEQNQYVAGRKQTDYDWSFVCTGHLTNLSHINIQERTQ